jgi:hypothetical protein
MVYYPTAVVLTEAMIQVVDNKASVIANYLARFGDGLFYTD